METIDGIVLKKMIISGANKLEMNKDMIDSLNVFPVPDGDTGTNMSYTVMASAREVEGLHTPNAYDVMKAASGGSLRGARGNSGVILSQLFRGYAKGLEGNSTITTDTLASSLTCGAETAYKAVMKPKEGTILTVAREIAEKAVELAFDEDDIETFLMEIIKFGKETLEKTTSMLPELAQAGVVDAGGKGLICILEGFLQGLRTEGDVTLKVHSASAKQEHFAGTSPTEIKFGYCTEFFINVDSPDEGKEEALKKYLDSMGDSIVVAADDDIIKVHVHTNHPGTVLERSMKYGSLSNLKIENMRMQHTSLISFSSAGAGRSKSEHRDSELVAHAAGAGRSKSEHQDSELVAHATGAGRSKSEHRDSELLAHAAGATKSTQQEAPKETGFVAVAAGSGITKLLKGMGVDEIIEGGQTMNPSTEDILKAVGRVNAENVIILPNNRNIILAAKQAQELSNQRDKKIHVLETATIPQGIAAMLRYLSTMSVQENLSVMSDAIKEVLSGQVTYAVRDSVFADKPINEGDILCMVDGKIELVSADLSEGVKGLIDIMLKKFEGEFVGIYYGEGVAEEEAEKIVEYINETYEHVEVELRYGGQPVYFYILSVE